MVEMEVLVVGQVQESRDHVLILREKNGDRMLVIGIGPCEAMAIALPVQDVHVGRPMTHDLLVAVISRLRGEIRRVVIHDLKADAFIAVLEIDTAMGLMEVDCRPSDGVAIAVRAGVPIVVTEGVLTQAAVRGERPVE